MSIKRLSLAIALALSSGSVLADTVFVKSSSDSGPNSFRAAVEAANSDSDIDKIRFDKNLVIELESEVVYTGEQELRIVGRNSTLSGATADVDLDTWDSGLFVSLSNADLTIQNLAFENSFNNGLAVFLPEDSDDVTIKLHKISVSNSQFFGVIIDGQATTGFNTDDIIHYACSDPHPYNNNANISVIVTGSQIVNNGLLAGGYDISLATGCPQDFDGLRVDQGGEGDLLAKLVNSNFDGNLADGVELDEKGDGSVDAEVRGSTFHDNGYTVKIECTDAEQCGSDFGELIKDLDDGFDIDEEDAGDLIAEVSRTAVNGNQDEGLDFDEAGDGSIDVEVKRVTADGNEDEALKASEEDAGDVTVEIKRSSFTNGGDDGTQLEEEGDGSIEVEVKNSIVSANKKAGVKVEEADAGEIEVEIKRSTITDNGKAGVNVESDDGYGSLEIKRTDLTGNADPYDTNVDDVEVN